MDIDVSAEDLAAARRILAGAVKCIDDADRDWSPLSDALNTELAVRGDEPESLWLLIPALATSGALLGCALAEHMHVPSQATLDALIEAESPSLRLLE
jgi:hypothetical protein